MAQEAVASRLVRIEVVDEVLQEPIHKEGKEQYACKPEEKEGVVEYVRGPDQNRIGAVGVLAAAVVLLLVSAVGGVGAGGRNG